MDKNSSKLSPAMQDLIKYLAKVAVDDFLEEEETVKNIPHKDEQEKRFHD